MDIQQNNVAILHFNLVNQDGSTIFIRKTKLATFNLINPSAVSVPITDIGFDATLNQCWVRVPKESNAATGQYYGVLNIVDDDWGTYTTSKIKVYSVVSDADKDTKSVVFTATCIATQVTNPSGGNSPYYNTTTGTWWQYSDTLKAFKDTGVGNLIKYITKNVQHLKDGTGNGSIVTCLDDEISANNIATGLCSTDFGKNNDNRGESCVALGENNHIPEGVSNATAIAGAQPSAVDVFAIGDKTAGHKNIFEINKFGDIYFRPDSSQERTTILQDILNSVIKNVVYDSSNYSLTVTFYSAADNANKTKTYDLSGLKAVLKDDVVKEISVNQATAVMTVDTINGSSQQIQLPTTSTKAIQDGSGNVITSTYLPISGGRLTGPLRWTPESALEAASLDYILGIDSFDLGGTTRWCFARNVTVGNATKAVQDGSGNDIASTYATKTELNNHVTDVSNPHKVTKSQVGLGNVDNTSDVNKPISTATQTALDTKQAKGDYATNTSLNSHINNVNNPHKVTKSQVGLGNVDNTSDVNKVVKGVLANVSTTDDYGHVWFSNIAFDTSRVYDDAFEYNPYTDTLKVGTVIGSITGNSDTATKLDTARNIGLSGVTSTAQSFDGSANITIPITAVPATLLTGTASISTTGNAATATKATQDASGNDIVSTYATKTELSNHTSIQPFDFLDSNEAGTFWTQTSTNSIAVAFMTDSKVVTHKVRIFIGSTEGAKIRCAIYKKESDVLSLVTQTQLYTDWWANFLDIPFETVTTLDSGTLYFFAFECSSKDSTFLGKQINASLLSGLVYKGDAFNANSDTFKSQYPTNGVVNSNVFIPYFKII